MDKRELKSIDEMCSLVSEILILILKNNHQKENNSSNSNQKTPFDSVFKKDYDFERFLLRINKSSKCHKYTFIYTLALVDFYCKETKFIMKENNYARLFLIAFYISLKMNEDYYISEEDFAIIGSIKTKKLRKLETLFLNDVNYRVYMSPSYVYKYADSLLA